MYALTWQSDDGNFQLECGVCESEVAAFLKTLGLHEQVKAECERHGVDFKAGAFKTTKITEDAWLHAADPK